MATYTFECEPIMVTQITGRLGAALVDYRGHAYRLEFAAAGVLACTRDGVACSIKTLPAPVVKHAVHVHGLLRRGYEMRA